MTHTEAISNMMLLWPRFLAVGLEPRIDMWLGSGLGLVAICTRLTASFLCVGLLRRPRFAAGPTTSEVRGKGDIGLCWCRGGGCREEVCEGIYSKGTDD